jgi:predicted transcriptional regulator
MTTTLTIRLDKALGRRLDQLCKSTGQSRSDIVRDALRRELSVRQFEGLRRRALPFAEARGYLTDEDVMRDIS